MQCVTVADNRLVDGEVGMAAVPRHVLPDAWEPSACWVSYFYANASCMTGLIMPEQVHRLLPWAEQLTAEL